jgi:hypothetical protein
MILLFLTSISKNLYYRTAQFVENKTINNFKKAIKEIIQIYNNMAGFHIEEIRSDNDFQTLKDPIFEEFEICMHFSNPQEHIPEAKQNNFWIKR